MKTFKLLVVLGIIGAAAYLAMLVVPVYWNYYQFQDDIATEARTQSYTNKSESDIRDTIWKKAKSYDLPLRSEDDIKVQKSGGIVAIATQYTVHINYPIHPFDLNFQAATENKPAF